MVFPFHAAAYAEPGFPLARKFIRGSTPELQKMP